MSRLGCAGALLLWSGVVGAESPAMPEDFREAVAGGQINWTTLRVETTRSWTGSGVDNSRRTVEHQAYLTLGDGVANALSAMQVSAPARFPELYEDVGLGDALQSRSSRWYVLEAHYFTSNRVELIGALDLPELLRPWTLKRAVDAPNVPLETKYSGVLIDARGLGARAAFAPRLVDEAGAILWDGQLWADVATRTTPALFVSTPAHPASLRAGEAPLPIIASAAEGASLTLNAQEAARLAEASAGTRLLGDGRVVIVLDP